MEASRAASVVVLSEQIATIRQVLALIDGGATISAFTLRPPERALVPPAARPPAPSRPPERDPEETDSQETGPEEPVTEEGAADIEAEEAIPEGELTVSAEGLTAPPQMMQAIRAQEIEIWRAAAAELERLGATGFPAPPQGETTT